MILETRDKQFPRWQEPQFSLRQVLAEASLSFIPDTRTMRTQKRHLHSVRVMHSLWQVREGLGWWVSTFWWHTEAALPKDTGCARYSGASQAMVWMGVHRHSMCRRIWEVVEMLGDLGIGTQRAISDLTIYLWQLMYLFSYLRHFSSTKLLKLLIKVRASVTAHEIG